MTQLAFSTGTVIAKRTDVANQPPMLMGVLQDLEIDFSRTLKPLMGQYDVPEAVGAGALKITGKAKFARFQANNMANYFAYGASVTPSSGLMLSTGESHTVPASSSYVTTVTNSSGFIEDMGAFYTSGGIQLNPTTGTPSQGQYSVSSGVYTFNSLDASQGITIFYDYTVTSLNQITLSHQLMGPAPTFKLTATENFPYYGTNKQTVLQLNACIAEKLTMPFKNEDWMIQEFDFQAYRDISGNWGTLATVE